MTNTTIHVVLDTLRMHKGKQVQAWLKKHPRFEFHHQNSHSRRGSYQPEER